MKDITSELSEEHRNILKLIERLFRECDQLGEGKEPDKVFFGKAIDFIRNYSDKYHHAKEEDILFTAMLDNVEVLHCNPIPVMLHEHDSGRIFAKGMEDGLKENNIELIIESAVQYGQLLQEHIYKEDNVLYPMAEEAFNEEQKESILRKYDAVTSDGNTVEEIRNHLSWLDEETDQSSSD